MKIKLGQLTTHLKKGLVPIYFVLGEELLLIEEAATTIRDYGKIKGFSERTITYIEHNSDWNQLSQTLESFSLFTTHRLIELRISGTSINQQGVKLLQTYSKNTHPDILLLIIGQNLGNTIQKNKWFLEFERLSTIVQIPKIDAHLLPQWIEQRMNAKGLYPTSEAVQMLSFLFEGNLLACAQEIERLVLLYPKGRIDTQEIEKVVTNCARYHAFRLIHGTLAGKIGEINPILEGLRAEGIDILVILGAFAWELRRLARISQAINYQGISLEQALEAEKVWVQQKLLVKQALNRHSLHSWLMFLQQLSRIDLMVKGAVLGNIWDELLQLCLAIAGTQLFPYQNQSLIFPGAPHKAIN
ncbi:DNA polymerase III subunit delta [Candidatus Nitrosacidococcus tergens]|uniref:DNA polymerase III subunit delta n=1 Tax=Candidatus Nitrosacidococcus tergens TaxID=553981 RepID=A0A7G1QBD7_9GAMM|nr:DNA polymerase III subunit delta [Candidatus Nitrosacidococcus tergens]CAB1277128.1 DNA polymerase III, delta subunit [Candidatus Nitrosacidococcus tergens]